MDRTSHRFQPAVTLLEDRTTPAVGTLAVSSAIGSVVSIYTASGAHVRTLAAFESNFHGGVRVSIADVNGDGTPDVIAGSGPGRPATVRIFNGTDGQLLSDVQPFGPDFTGGVFVAAGDMTSDGKAEIVVTPDQGGGPRVVLLRGGDFVPVASFFAIDDPNFRGGARVAVGYFNGDTVADVVVAAGFGGGPRVAGFDGGSLFFGTPRKLFNDFFAFEPALRNGTYIAIGDVDGNGIGDLIAGGGPGGGPRVRVLSGSGLMSGIQVSLANFFAGSTSEREGVPVAACDLNGDGQADIIAGSGVNALARIYSAGSLISGGAGASLLELNPFPGLLGGVYVAGAPGAIAYSPTVVVPPLPTPERVVVVGTTEEFRVAVNAATPGSEIRVRPGTYSGGLWFGNLHGQPGREIVITALDPNNAPIFQGGGNGIQFSDVSYLQLRNLIFDGAQNNGVNIDDYGTFDTPSTNIKLIGLTVRNVGPDGNRDGIKLSGVDLFLVSNCTLTNWGSSGSGIDMVGCHQGVIEGNTFRHTNPNVPTGLQAKGGSSHLIIQRNRFENAGLRAVQIGGSTDLNFFRPQPVPGYEASNVTVQGNVIIGSEAAVAFVNADGAMVRFNTIYRPSRWVFRILQEQTGPGFVPTRNGIISDNIIAYSSSQISTIVNVGANTSPGTFQFARNWWYAIDTPTQSAPTLPTVELNGTFGIDPLFLAPAAGDLRLRANSPASNAGAYSPLL